MDGITSEHWSVHIFRQLGINPIEWVMMLEWHNRMKTVHRSLWQRKFDGIQLYLNANDLLKFSSIRHDYIEQYAQADYFVGYDCNNGNVVMCRHAEDMPEPGYDAKTRIACYYSQRGKITPIADPLPTASEWLGLGGGRSPLNQCVQYAWNSGYKSFEQVCEFVRRQSLFMDVTDITIATAWGHLLAALHPKDRKF